jgi:hypothetical protein
LCIFGGPSNDAGMKLRSRLKIDLNLAAIIIAIDELS